MGRVTALYWKGDEPIAVSLAEMADGQWSWPGIESLPPGRIRLMLANSKERFDSLTAGRLPHWGLAAAYPATNTIILKTGGDLRRVLRHELAHLALHSVVQTVPLWFDEGYAARAAGEWHRLDALRVNWALATGRVPNLGEVASDLRGGAVRAEAAYAFATTAVLFLERLGGDRGLMPLISNLRSNSNFDLALRRTHALSLSQFEEMWRKELKGRYGWLLFLTSFGVFWTVVLIVFGWVWLARRKRDRERRRSLDDGWTVAPEEWGHDA